MGYRKGITLAQNIKYLAAALTEEELRAIDDILVKALQRVGREMGEKLEGVDVT